jgi:hypothetical protein
MSYWLKIFTDFRGNPYIFDLGDLNDGLIIFFENEYELLHPKDIFGDDFEKKSQYELTVSFHESWDYEYTECELTFNILSKRKI